MHELTRVNIIIFQVRHFYKKQRHVSTYARRAIDLRKLGHEVTVFEKLPVMGGMMAVGIPEYRLPRDILAWETSYL